MLPMLLKLLIFTFVKQVFIGKSSTGYDDSPTGDIGRAKGCLGTTSLVCDASGCSNRENEKAQLKICLGLLNWLNEVEVFAMLFAAAIHDYEHTGTTNTFHQQTRSNLGSFRIYWIVNKINSNPRKLFKLMSHPDLVDE